MYRRLLPLAFMLPILASGGNAKMLELPDWKAPTTTAGTPFQMGGGTTVHVWGRGAWVFPTYFDELLPALFERTLVFDQLDLSRGGLRWVFTGELGGFSVWIDKNKVALYQRFYDSYGLYTFEDDRPASGGTRVPDKRTVQEEIPYTGTIHAVRVVLSHALGLTLFVNDQEVFHQTCPLDVSRHQLQLTDNGDKVAGRMLAPQTAQARVTLDPAHKRQTMRGWGGITLPLAYRLLSPEGRRQWWERLCEYNLLVQREYPIGTQLRPEMDNWDDLAYAVPHYYGDNFPNSEISDFDYIRTIRSLGGEVWFEFWALPAWMNETWKDPDGNPITDSQGRTRQVANPEKWAEAMVDYCKTSNEKAGAPPDIVGIQNEAGQPPDVWYAMTRALRRKLDEAGFSQVKIHMTDSSNLAGGIERAKVFTREPEVWKLIDFSATHMYDYQQFFTRPDEYDVRLLEWHELTKDRPFLSSELCINDFRWQIQSYRVAFIMGQLYHKNLVLADACAISYCWMLLNVTQPSYGWTRTLFVPDEARGFVPRAGSHQLRIFGAYSRRIHAGMARIGARSSHTDLLASAFTGPDGQATLVLLNRSTQPIQLALEGEIPDFRWRETSDPYHENRVEPYGEDQLIVAPGSALTLSNVPLKQLPEGFRLPD